MTSVVLSALRRRAGLILCLALLIAGQAMLGPAIGMARLSDAAPVAICHTADPDSGGAPADQHPGGTACDLCIFCHGVAVAAMPPGPAMAVPSQRYRRVAGPGPVIADPVTAPRFLAHAHKTGPPTAA